MAAEARVIGNLALDVGEPSGAADRARRHPSLRTLRPLAKVDASPAALELGSLPARGLGGLPAAFTARMRAVDGSVFYLSTSPVEREALAESGAIALEAEEWEAITLAVETDRMWAGDLVQALRTRGVTGRLEVDALLDGVSYERATAELSFETGRDSRDFSVARVLQRIGARIDDVSFGTEASFP